MCDRQLNMQNCHTHSIRWVKMPPAGLRPVLVGRWAETEAGARETPNALWCFFFRHPSLLSWAQCRSFSAWECLRSRCWKQKRGNHIPSHTETPMTYAESCFSQGSHVVLRVEGNVQKFGARLDALLTCCAHHLPCYSAPRESRYHQDMCVRYHAFSLQDRRVLPVYLIERMRPYGPIISRSYKHL